MRRGPQRESSTASSLQDTSAAREGSYEPAIETDGVGDALHRDALIRAVDAREIGGCKPEWSEAIHVVGDALVLPSVRRAEEERRRNDRPREDFADRRRDGGERARRRLGHTCRLVSSERSRLDVDASVGDDA